MTAKKKDLEKYNKKRNFEDSPEPKGSSGKKKSKQPTFVIQQHDARNLHFDFRLEVDGVLKSWAVPKGPSTNPSDKRLAIEVEDHPLDYANFEGIIPEGNYGAGTVIVWDNGTYKNIMAEKDDPLTMEESIEKGHVEVWLKGKKIKGAYALVRTPRGNDKPQWLLIKMKDEEADARRKPTKTEPKSVISGKTLSEMEKGS